MYLIDNVSTVEGDSCNVAVMRQLPASVDLNDGCDASPFEYETVHSKVFYDGHGNHVAIGATKEVLDKIGIIFGMCEDRTNSFDSFVGHARIMYLQRELRKAKIAQDILAEMNALPNNIDSLVKERYERKIGYF